MKIGNVTTRQIREVSSVLLRKKKSVVDLNRALGGDLSCSPFLRISLGLPIDRLILLVVSHVLLSVGYPSMHARR